uniref:Uncharacterized protein n=1 Tax=Rhizophagus irregularis (strain DAOM 181602 / DAOM 197198 / MUCL 43194) TaxID=747089 RepID=U9U1N4_RHIID
MQLQHHRISNHYNKLWSYISAKNELFKLAQVVLACILLIWWLKDWQFFKDESFSLPTYKENRNHYITKNGDHPKRSNRWDAYCKRIIIIIQEIYFYGKKYVYKKLLLRVI